MSEILHQGVYARRLQDGFEAREKLASDVIAVLGVNAKVNGAEMHVVKKQVFIAPGSPLEMTDVKSLTGFEEGMRAGLRRTSVDESFELSSRDYYLTGDWHNRDKTPELVLGQSPSMGGGSNVRVVMYPDDSLASFMAEVARQDSVYVTSQFEHLQKRISQKDIDEAKSGELHRQLQEAILTNKRRGL